MWIYSSTMADDRWVVGYYTPNDGIRYPQWVTITTHKTEMEAAARVSYLNGGQNIDCMLERIITTLNDIASAIWSIQNK